MPKTYVSTRHWTRLDFSSHQKESVVSLAGCLRGTKCSFCPWGWLCPSWPSHSPSCPLPSSISSLLPLSGLLVPIFPSFVHFSPSSLDTLAPPSPSFLPPLPRLQHRLLRSQSSVLFILHRLVSAGSGCVSRFPLFISSLCLSWAGQVWPLAPDSLGSGSDTESAPTPCSSSPRFPLSSSPPSTPKCDTDLGGLRHREKESERDKLSQPNARMIRCRRSGKRQ